MTRLPRVLYVDDDRDTRDLIITAFGFGGIEVVATDNAATALELVRADSFGVCLLDYTLPESSGVELTRKIRETNLRTPIVFLSGADTQADIDRALDAGAQRYFIKPFDLDVLIDEVRRLIETSQEVQSPKSANANG